MEETILEPEAACGGHSRAELEGLSDYVAQVFEEVRNLALARSNARRAEWGIQAKDYLEAEEDPLYDPAVGQQHDFSWGMEGYELLGAGADRVVVGLDKEHALKICFPGRGRQADVEQQIYEGASKELREMLVEVLATSEAWTSVEGMAMPEWMHGAGAGPKWTLVGRAEEITKSPRYRELLNERGQPSETEEFCDLYDLDQEDRQVYVILAEAFPDLAFNIGNFGRRNGRLVAMDYGWDMDALTQQQIGVKEMLKEAEAGIVAKRQEMNVEL